MMTIRGLYVVAAAVLVARGAGALAPADKCEAGKLKVAGKYDFCRLKAEAKAVQTGAAPDFSKCDSAFAAKWSSAEAGGAGMCPSSGDLTAIQAFVTQHTDDLAMALAGGALPDCAGDLATCNADLSTCATNAATCTTNLAVATTNLAACTGNLTSCTANLTIAQACGNGVVDGGEACDFGALNGASCATLGFLGGALACGSGCAYDTSGCWNARFVDNADGTVTDRRTGLRWEKKTELDFSINLANPHDADNNYGWSGTCSLNPSKLCQPTSAAAALCAANAEGGATGCAQCSGGEGTCSAATTVWTWAVDLNAASFAGATNWRIPTMEELDGLVDRGDASPPVIDAAFMGASCGAPCTDITNPLCSCTQADAYWTASTYAVSPPAAWVVFFVDGATNAYYRANDARVRAVHDGP